MSIFLNANSKVIVQGITGGEGTKHTALMLKAGTQVVGGVNARKAGTTVSHVNKDGQGVELPVFGSVAEAIKETGADVSIAFVPPAFAKDAIIEAIDTEIPLLVVITEGIPVQDTAYAWAYNVDHGLKTRIIGPNCPGIITPGESLVGITPANITGKGPIGLVSKSGTLTYQMMYELRDLGFSTAIGIGGDPVIGTTHIDAIEAFEKDPETKVIVMIGEIGGDAEERAADYIKANVSKPVVYEHFGSKDGLYAVIVDREMNVLLGMISDSLTADNPRALLEQAARALFDYIEERADGFRVLVRDSPVAQNTGNFASLLRDVASQVDERLAKEFEAKGFPSKYAPMYANMLVGMVALTGQWWLDVRKPKKEEVVAHVVNLAWNGIVGLDKKPRLVTER